MPATVAAKSSAKRKRQDASGVSKKRTKTESDDEDGQQSRILLLENEILESRKNYNNIGSLIEIAQSQDEDLESAVVAAVSLCRVFIRLLAAGSLAKRKDLAEKDTLIMRWLRERLSDYQQCLLSMLEKEGSALTALTLLMRLLKAVTHDLDGMESSVFPKTFFNDIVRSVLQPAVDDNVRTEFMDKFVEEYDDVRFHTFRAVRYASPGLYISGCGLT